VFTIEVPEGTGTLRFRMTGGSGDADIFVRHGARPDAVSYDCVSGNIFSEEECIFDLPSAGTWYVLVFGYDSYSGASLRASLLSQSGATPLASNVPVIALSGAAESFQMFAITVPAAPTRCGSHSRPMATWICICAATRSRCCINTTVRRTQRPARRTAPSSTRSPAPGTCASMAGRPTRTAHSPRRSSRPRHRRNATSPPACPSAARCDSARAARTPHTNAPPRSRSTRLTRGRAGESRTHRLRAATRGAS
jgi:hypothetical protein